MPKISDSIVSWVRKQVNLAGAKGIVVGLSGGLDSSVVAVLSKKAFPDNVLALILPCKSSPQDVSDAKMVAEKYGIETRQIDIEPVFEALFRQLEDRDTQMNLAVANLKPRLRMIALYYYANKLNYLVAGTGNKSELMMGYFTKYGDGGVDILPLGGLYKSEVAVLARELDIPKEIIEKVPSAGLWPGQTDEGEMGITYAELEKVLSGLEKKELAGLDAKLVELVSKRVTATEHKRKLPEIYEGGET